MKVNTLKIPLRHPVNFLENYATVHLNIASTDPTMWRLDHPLVLGAY
jgi:hypothetical protein